MIQGIYIGKNGEKTFVIPQTSDPRGGAASRGSNGLFNGTAACKIDGYRWHYIDLQEFEDNIRFDERKKMRERRGKPRGPGLGARLVLSIRNHWMLALAFSLVSGTAGFCGSGLTYTDSIHGNNWALALFTIPAAAALLYQEHIKRTKNGRREQN